MQRLQQDKTEAERLRERARAEHDQAQVRSRSVVQEGGESSWGSEWPQEQVASGAGGLRSRCVCVGGGHQNQWMHFAGLFGMYFPS